VRSVVNLLRRFDVEIPAERLRLRNVAAVLVTAEVSPWLRSGGRFDVQVSALGDATSLRGGVLWITPLVSDPDQPPQATAQGAVRVQDEGGYRGARSTSVARANSARIAEGGVLEAEPPPAPVEPRLRLRDPDLVTASRVAAALNAAFGDSTATVEDPGLIALAPPPDRAASLPLFLAAADTVRVRVTSPARVVIDGREGTVVAGGDVTVGPAVVSHRGLTLQVGGGAAPAAGGATPEGLVRLDGQSTVRDVAAGLHAAGARPEDVAAVFDALRAAGALHAEVVVR
jgi:flagellar P-ring protein precursor FlgI